MDASLNVADDVTGVIMVAIHTDGLGTYQARCLGCEWKGRWVRAEARAAKHAQDHRH